MNSLNKVQLIGNLGADPETRFTASGSAVTNLRIATTDKWRDKQTGEAQERTEWHTVTAWGKLAEIMDQYLTKGARVYIEGRLTTEKWQDNSGQDRYTTKVVARDMIMLSGGAEKSNSDAKPKQQGGFRNAPQQEEAFTDEDIPF